jgi:UDP-N-acetylglucosamine--dolichyl-phosphate N-acetylglucosaminephosphotransferase
MTASLSKLETWALLGLVFASFAIIFNALQVDGAPLTVSLAFSAIAFSGTYSLIRWLGPTFIKAGLKGKDMSKPTKKEMYCSVCSKP